ncbi:efflux RND transporter permease subunit [soil metagenome]
MWIVRLALRRPYTFVVMAMGILLMGILTILRMPTDIFPEIDIPVISIVWSYGGLPPEEMDRRIVGNFERFITTTVNDIEHVESQTLNGVGVIKVFLQPDAKLEAATAQITAVSQTAVRQMPPGATPPLIIRYSASNVPIMQMMLDSETLPEQFLFDYGINFVRAGLTTVYGAQMPYPYGGRQRQVVVDLDVNRMYGWNLSARDISAAINTQNLILPSGTIKIGENEYPVLTNASPDLFEELNAIPVRTANGTTVYVRDVANVHDGFSPQTNIVHANGRRAVLLPILKGGKASTLEVAGGVRAAMPGIMATVQNELNATLLFDQSLFVRAAVDGVVKEGLIAALLTGLMILIFLGSWRSTLIVVVSIPLSILVSIIALSALGQTLNVMTLGGLSLAVGILVDDATVEIENIHRNFRRHPGVIDAILHGAQQIAVPALVSTLCICIVFIPVAFLTGASRSLFLPLAMAVVFAMLTSYLLSRTLVPTLVRYLLAGEAKEHREGRKPPSKRNVFGRFHAAFERQFERIRTGYGKALGACLHHRKLTLIAFGIVFAGSFMLYPAVGRDFFPSVDAGLIRLHVRCPPGTRVEETEKRFADIEATIATVVPKSDTETLLDNMGVPVSGINLSLGDPSMISSADGEILIALKPDHARPTPEYVRELRTLLKQKYPDTTFFFLAPDISTQVLNFGISAPIDVQFVGPVGNQPKNLALARDLVRQIEEIPGAVDVHLHQVPNLPELRVDVDRSMASQVGLTARDIASDMLLSTSSSTQTAPGYWLDRTRGIQYIVAVQTPQWRMDSVEALESTPISLGPTKDPQLLGNIAKITPIEGPVNITHYNAFPTYDVLANVDGVDLGSVADGVAKAIKDVEPKLPRGSSIKTKGQVESMSTSFRGLAYGLVFAIILVYLLLVVNFQSWLDPLVILMALPGALSGIAWSLYVTHTTLSVPALMGAIMCVGVATSNSVLVVTFANDQRKGKAPRDSEGAALAAGMTRLRPVVMTALAMIVGMVPMSLGVGEGGEQNAPLARAVIGGLLFATFATLFFVPVVYAAMRKKAPVVSAETEALV